MNANLGGSKVSNRDESDSDDLVGNQARILWAEDGNRTPLSLQPPHVWDEYRERAEAELSAIFDLNG